MEKRKEGEVKGRDVKQIRRRKVRVSFLQHPWAIGQF